ncbi:signal peptide-containing protein, putative [Babesia ovata]|uniref:Signal peptide-containing protein, putative n=1 Tax=Babesia ovata TaxID=189622 RepID=A0A2H6KFK5_9APIC|nr:signal peptide-containing protein, putative [Babesia ovata]GBE61770.1 signal peptide-containing protein, putative [Babesia ovata]
MRFGLALLLSFMLSIVNVNASGFAILKSASVAECNAMGKPGVKQADKLDPSRHYMNRALVYCYPGAAKYAKPVIQFVMLGGVDDLQKKLFKDVSLIITRFMAVHDSHKRYCRNATVNVCIEKIVLDKYGKITSRKQIDCVMTPNMTTPGTRIRVTFSNVLQNPNVDYENFHVTINGQRNCTYGFVVELEEPNNYGDTVRKAT